MRVLLVFTAILLCGLAAAGGLNPDSPWPKFRHDLKNTGRTQYTGPTAPTLDWTYLTGDFVVSSPTIGSDGTIYFGSGIRRSLWIHGETDSSLYALNPNGTLKWKYTTLGGLFSSPTIAEDGTIYIGSFDRSLYAIEDSVTYGRLKWKTDLGFHLLASPTIGSDGSIYMGSPDFNFYILDPDGTIRWNYSAGWCIISSPALINDNTVYIGSKDHNLYAFDVAAETPLWASPTGTFYDGHLVDASPAVGPDGTIYVGTDQKGAAGTAAIPVDSGLWAMRPNGTVKWVFPTGSGVESSAAIGSDGTIYFGSFDSCFYALADSGSYPVMKWKFQTGGSIDCSPAIDGDGVIYFGSRDSVLYALYPDGSVKWTYTTGGSIESSPTIDDNGYLYVGSFDSSLYAFGTGAPDVGAVSVEIPSHVLTTDQFPPTAWLRNYRGADLNIDVTCTIDTNGITVYSNTLSDFGLTGGSESLATFASWQVGPDTGVVYNVSVNTTVAGDLNIDNDSTSKQLVSIAEQFICGDANNDQAINVGDAVYLINYVFKSGPAPDPLASGETNCDGSVNVGDAVYLINYVFKGGAEPCSACP
ncbi:MAG: PQQ-binding-like beta-propeller repeat protein [FCB group bacterium]|nr:PQQ-binding-like beta-propeller repeat protein [FCB group bacterium]